MLTIFYDSHCPLCNKEMMHLKRLDTDNRILLEDLHQADFSCKFPEIDKARAMQTLHAKLDEQMIYGIDVTFHAWKTVGKEHWVRSIKHPWFRPLYQIGYRFFSRHRSMISRLLMGKSQCNDGQCYRK